MVNIKKMVIKSREEAYLCKEVIHNSGNGCIKFALKRSSAASKTSNTAMIRDE